MSVIIKHDISELALEKDYFRVLLNENNVLEKFFEFIIFNFITFNFAQGTFTLHIQDTLA